MILDNLHAEKSKANQDTSNLKEVYYSVVKEGTSQLSKLGSDLDSSCFENLQNSLLKIKVEKVSDKNSVDEERFSRSKSSISKKNNEDYRDSTPTKISTKKPVLIIDELNPDYNPKTPKKDDEKSLVNLEITESKAEKKKTSSNGSSKGFKKKKRKKYLRTFDNMAKQ